MPRPERALSGDGPVEGFAADLRRLREQAGRPPYRELARRAHYAAATLAAAAGGRRLPTLAVTLAYVRACGGDPVVWEARWRAVAAQLAGDRAGRGGPEPPRGGVPAPWRGLAAYQAEDAEWFFGRQRLVTDLVQRLTGRRFLAVFGPSGCGKSSLLRAGLVPAAGTGALVGGHGWPVVVMTPGGHPLAELALQLAHRAGVPARAVLDDLRADPAGAGLVARQGLVDEPAGVELLLVVDQFEEVFTHGAHEAERAEFVAALLALAQGVDSRARVVLGVRADFYARCAEYPDLVEALADAQVLVGTMSVVEVREAIVKPAERAGLMVEAALVSTVVAAVAGRVGALPLASHALLEAWRRRRGIAVTLAGYEAAGGLEGAVAQTAERVYDDLDDEQQAAARDLLLRMVEVDADGSVSRRRVDRSELGTTDLEVSVVERLAAARLLTVGEDTAELAHEALITAWPRLRGWVDEDRDGLRLHRQLTESATIWRSLNQDPSVLYRGIRLGLVQQWSQRSHAALSPLEGEFITASEDAAARVARQRRRRLRLAVSGLATVSVLVSVLAAVAVQQAGQARTERDVAYVHQLAADAHAQLTIDPERALLLAQQAYEFAPSAESETILRQATLDSRLIAVRPGYSTFDGVAFHPDGRHLATSDDQVRIWDAVTRSEQTYDIGKGFLPSTVAYSPDGRRLATARTSVYAEISGEVAPDDYTVAIWDTAHPTDPVIIGGHRSRLKDVVFSPDGRHLASTGYDGTVHIDPTDGRPGRRMLRGHRGLVWGVAYSPDGAHLTSAGADGTVRIDPAGGPGMPVVLRGHQGAVLTVAYSPDGQHIASGGDDGTIRLWATRHPHPSGVLISDGGRVTDLAYSSDGQRLAAARADGTIQIWDTTSTAQPPVVLRGHRADATAVAFSPNGQLLASTAIDGVRLWDTGGRLQPRALRDQQRVWSAAVSPDGRSIISGGNDGTIRMRDIAGRGEPRVLRGHHSSVRDLSVSANGHVLASLADDGIQVWNLTTPAPAPVTLRTFSRSDSGFPPLALALSPDGRRLVTVDIDGAFLWKTTQDSHPHRVLPSWIMTAQDVAFSPDGRYIAIASWDVDGSVWLVDPARPAGNQPPRLLHSHNAPANSVAFSPDGRHIASVSRDGTLRISTIDGTSKPVVLSGTPAAEPTVAFSPDGRWVATTSRDSTIRIWNTHGGAQPINFTSAGATFNTAIFTPDGQGLVTTHPDSAARIWQCEICGPIDQVHALANRRVTRQLTPDERHLFLHEPNR